MNRMDAFIPEDRRQALATVQALAVQQTGALLFADISGSTQLTDALIASLGATQAVDRLTTLINRCFAALIAEVHCFAGTVISFGGDGILAIFANDSGQRAITCAFQMQAAMTKFQHYSIDTSRVVALRLKLTIAHGVYYRLAVGDPMIQRLELVTGPALSDVAALLRTVQAGQVLIAEPLWRRFGAQLLPAPLAANNTERTGMAVVAWVALPPLVYARDQEAVGAATTISLPNACEWIAKPVADRLRQEEGAFLAEIRPVTVLFLDFSGLQCTQAGALGDADTWQPLHDYVSWVQRLLMRHNGTLLKVTFDDKGTYGVIVFGAPKGAHGDTARALTAALDLLNVPTEFHFTIPVKIGMHRGRVLAGAFGSLDRAAYDLLGSAVNRCSRFMIAAQPGEILLSAAVYADAGDAFQIQAVGTMQFKGIAEPLAVYRLHSHHPTEFIMPAAIVGRERELAQLHSWFKQSRTGAGQIVIVEGPAGIGKSHLVGGFARQAVAAGAVAAVGICDYVGRQIPYYPWRSILERLVTTHFDRTTLPLQQQALLATFLDQQPQATVMDGPTTTLHEPQRRQEALFALVSEIIVACASTQPVVLVLEDLYYCDQVSLDLLRVVSRLVPDHALLLLLVQHPNPPAERTPLIELQQQPYYHKLLIEELLATSIATIVAECLQGAAEPLLLDLIHHQSQGNPLHAEEFALALRDLNRLDYATNTALYTLNTSLIAALRAANCLVRDGETGAWRLRPNAVLSVADLGLPDILHASVNTRVDQVAEALTLTLYTAALLGQRFSSSLLSAAHIAKPTAAFIHEHLAQLVEAALLVHNGRDGVEDHYMFRHNLVQKVIYERVPEQQKQVLHLRIGEALEQLQPEAVEQLAFHFARTDQSAKAQRYLATAAHKSRSEFANEAALNFYEQALQYEPRLEWQIAKVELLHILGHREAEQAHLDLLAAHAPQLSFTYPYLWAKYYEATGHYATAQQFAEQAFQLASACGDTMWAASSLLLLGLIARRQGNYAQAIQRHQQGIAIINSLTVTTADNMTVNVDLKIGLSNVLRQQGKYEEARTYCQQALALCRQWENRRGEADIMNTLGGIAYYLREFADARQYHQHALHMRRSAGELRGEGISLYGLALLDYEEGAYDLAIERLQQVSAILQAAHDPWEEANILNLLGVIYYQLGNQESAYATWQHGLHLSDQIDDQVGKGYIICNLGMLARDDEQWEAAERALLAAIKLARSQQERQLYAMTLSHLAILRLQQRYFGKAIQLAQRAIRIREELGIRELTTIDYTTIALAYQQQAQPEQAREAIEAALRLLDECQGIGPEFPHWDYYHCFVVLWWLGDEARALTALQKAYEILMKRAQAIRDPQTQAEFLTKVPIHQKILAAAAQHGLS